MSKKAGMTDVLTPTLQRAIRECGESFYMLAKLTGSNEPDAVRQW
jgi:hypothetical protein